MEVAPVAEIRVSSINCSLLVADIGHRTLLPRPVSDFRRPSCSSSSKLWFNHPSLHCTPIHRTQQLRTTSEELEAAAAGILCEACNGKGWLICDLCQGQKTNAKANNNRIYRRCPSCKAIGYVLCPKCKVFKCVTFPNDDDDGNELSF